MEIRGGDHDGARNATQALPRDSPQFKSAGSHSHRLLGQGDPSLGKEATSSRREPSKITTSSLCLSSASLSSSIDDALRLLYEGG
eukprot:CAMPEP_0175075318 /NCGR_PEP_ID=MMETSP0052_2-20121109/21923_1 /TAXON_ID=51329 ORGANISM="Polytomella parva, Strain SAG 63-3" /NCGR_SAMPLE_ID=MMETSP0052_2 /ASSEMBLY_ACC=CAM_ASM_000194 /LENGTH=84 /DNA_ID=CAMNT_0016343969 /DNA_START=225 /DNA_END=476 /DNA_ORIENTATION=-